MPEGCGRRLDRVEVRETRPAGMNLPTAAAVAATRQMREALAALRPDDLAIAIITGGGSALLEDPRDGVTLDGLVAVTRGLAAAGADIRELNVVRQALSGVKAGGLARACAAGRLVTLVLSDVIGDPLDVIVSGPCMPVCPDSAGALAILRRHGVDTTAIDVTRWLEQALPAAGPCCRPCPEKPLAKRRFVTSGCGPITAFWSLRNMRTKSKKWLSYNRIRRILVWIEENDAFDGCLDCKGHYKRYFALIAFLQGSGL